MSFGSPLFLLVLLVVPAVLLFALAVERRRARFAVAFTNLELLAGGLERRRSWRRYVPLVLLVAALAFAAGALARPRAQIVVAEPEARVVLVVDVSGSMAASDVEPTRLGAAVAAMRTFLARLPRQVKVGLIAFSSAPELLAQPTSDRARLADALGYLSPESTTAIGDALQAAVGMTVSSLTRARLLHRPGGRLPAAIVLLSDGAQDVGALQPLQAAARARAAGIRIDTVALGSTGGAMGPDAATMRAIAHATGGSTYIAQTAASVATVYKTLGASVGSHNKSLNIASWFAGAAALLLLGALATARLTDATLP